MARMTKMCPNCNVQFEVRVNGKSWIDMRKYCSRKCYGVANIGIPVPDDIKRKISLAQKGQHHSPETQFKAGHTVSDELKEIRRNDMLGNTYRRGVKHTMESRLKDSITKLTSPSTPRGEDHPQWRGGIPDRSFERRLKNLEWRMTRREVLTRDEYTCQNCDKVDRSAEDLHAHHLVPYRETQDDSPKNLVTLCTKCHALIENQNSENAHKIRVQFLKGIPK